MLDMTLTTREPVPAGMLETACGRLLPDTGHGRLLALLDEAYELHNGHVLVSTKAGDSRLALTNSLPEGDVALAPGLTARVGATEVLAHRSLNGRAHAVVRVDGTKVLLRWDDPYSLPEAAHAK